ncbi:hypothetical protein SELR_14580 [Selenomonas ruminantium subsp. lactilytica TAM6421]|uniref:Uncharacterized protein n=2 Tax=Selenomonas ruminantium TaxID=971 RepID=I0GQX9_SELRL|nr:hypothetical protein SELR_14580 [Selenomonas ruminantium subsp. lactilytica TAM6421]
MAYSAVKNFATIKLADNMAWQTEALVLSGGSFQNYGQLDITGVTTAFFAQKDPGTMTLLASNKENDFATLDLKYSAENSTILNSETPNLILKNTENPPTLNGVTIYYNTYHEVAIDQNNSYKNVLLNVVNTAASKLSFGDVEWLTSGALIDHSTQYTNISFEKAAIDTSKIHFTTGGTRSDGDIMTLVNAFGTSVGGSIGGPDGMNFTDANGKTGKGHAYFESGNLKYLVTTGTATSTPNPDPDLDPDPDTDKDDAINEGGDNISGQIDGDVTGGVAKNKGVAKENIKNVEEGILDNSLRKTYNLSVNLVCAYLNSTLNPEAFKPRDCFFACEKELLHVDYVQQPLFPR